MPELISTRNYVKVRNKWNLFLNSFIAENRHNIHYPYRIVYYKSLINETNARRRSLWVEIEIHLIRNSNKNDKSIEFIAIVINN